VKDGELWDALRDEGRGEWDEREWIENDDEIEEDDLYDADLEYK
jgi:hypothetical protein